MTYLRQVAAIIWKDIATEWRSRERVLATGAFAVFSVILFAMAFDRVGVSASDLAAPVIWMTLIFAGLLSVARTFSLEQEDGALSGLLQSPAPRDAIYLGKTIANTVIIFPVAILVLAAMVVLFDLQLPDPGATVTLMGTLVVGSFAFVSLGTLLAVISADSKSGDSLLLLLVLPVAVPCVVFGVGAAGRLLEGRPVTEAMPAMRWLTAFALVAVFSGSVLFRHLVEE